MARTQKLSLCRVSARFGDGTITWISADQKYMRVKFPVGEKQFLFPDAFIMGFLTLK